MQALAPAAVFTVLDLEHPELAAVAAAVAAGDVGPAAEALLAYWRSRPPSPVVQASHPFLQPPTEQDRQRADDALRHVFQWGPYPAYDYGPDIDWDADPRGDLEWRGRMHRMDLWVGETVRCYRATGDEKYAAAWVRLTADWIRKFPVDIRHLAHRDIQFATRANIWCAAFGVFVHSPAFTPEFLLHFLAAIYDSATKVMLHPRTSQMPEKHANNNKALMEAQGLLHVAVTFTAFKDAPNWLARSLEMVDATLRTQILPDGVQHEFAPGYHAGCTRMLAEMGALAQRVGADVPASFRETLDKMATYVLAMVTPEFSNPMFGDTRRPEGGRTYGELLVTLGGILNRPEFSAVAERRHAGLPPLNWCFPHGGMYFFRSGWGPDDIYMALHCCPPSAGGKKGGHDQPDNGTFELCAFGRWLMPDSGCFVYHESTAPLDRDWFRQTAVHQTLTLDNANSVNAPRHLFWWDTPELAVVRFENQSYPDLCHRRTVFFVQRRFFVIVDEALGDARGDLDLHVQLAPGPAQIDAGTKTARTKFADGGNVLVWTPAVQAARLEEEAGYTSSRYGHYEPRPAFRLRLADGPPAALLSVIVPYRGAKPPRVVAALEPGFAPGADSLAVRCELDHAAVVVGCDGRRAWLET